MKIRTGVVAFLFILLVGIVVYQYYVIHKQSSTTASTQSTQVSPSLALQAQCAKQAQVALGTFEQQMGSGYSYSQENHYDQSLGQCFVLIDYNPNTSTEQQADPNQPTMQEDLLDAYANTDLADCNYYNNRPDADISNPDSYTLCLIGNDKVSYKEYEAYVDQRMNLNE